MLWTNHFTQWKKLLFLSRLRRTSNVILKVANKELVEAFPTILDCSLSTPTLALDWSLKLCRPDSIWELDLSLQLFQFFFTGMKNQSRFYRRRRKTATTFFPIFSPQDILAWQGWHLFLWNAAKLFKNHKWHQFHRGVSGKEAGGSEEEHSTFAPCRPIHCFSRNPPPYLLNFFLVTHCKYNTESIKTKKIIGKHSFQTAGNKAGMHQPTVYLKTTSKSNR